MAKQLGRAMLLKIRNVGDTDYISLAGLNSKSLTINNNPIDVTTPDATTPGGALWTELLDGAKNVSVSGDGIFVDEAAELQLNTVAMASPPAVDFEITIPDFGTFTGTFHVTSLEYGGETEGGQTFSLSLASSGEIPFAAS